MPGHSFARRLSTATSLIVDLEARPTRLLCSTLGKHNDDGAVVVVLVVVVVCCIVASAIGGTMRTPLAPAKPHGPSSEASPN